MFPMSYSPSRPASVAKTKGLTIEKLQAQLEDRDQHIADLEQKLYGNSNEKIVDAGSEVVRLRAKLEHADRLVAEYKEQLHAQSLKTSVNNSKSHISEIELEKMRTRLQKRIEELEPLPELLRQAEMKNQELQTRLLEQEKRLMEQSQYLSDLNSKVISVIQQEINWHAWSARLDKCSNASDGSNERESFFIRRWQSNFAAETWFHATVNKTKRIFHQYSISRHLQAIDGCRRR